MTVYESLMIMINFGGLILNTVLLIFNIMMIVTSSQKKNRPSLELRNLKGLGLRRFNIEQAL
ncbi:hypothetical protein BVSY1_07750 [Bacillus velezensis]|nr:hypothetical protein BVSY1_07750 [Bacillus velezensis]